MIPQSRPIVLLTRPLAQSQRFATEMADRFGAMGCVISPLMVLHFLAADPAPTSDAVIFTSETGVAGATAAQLWPKGAAPRLAYCVGQRTMQAALAEGYQAMGAGGDWQDLVGLITDQQPKGPLTWACAAESPPHLQQALELAGYTLHRRDVYGQKAQPLSSQAHDVLSGMQPVLLPLFSPRSAQLFCTAATAPFAPLWIAALSPPVLSAFTLPLARHAVADRPNSAALLTAIQELL